jgi:hypothetical protein
MTLKTLRYVMQILLKIALTLKIFDRDPQTFQHNVSLLLLLKPLVKKMRPLQMWLHLRENRRTPRPKRQRSRIPNPGPGKDFDEIAAHEPRRITPKYLVAPVVTENGKRKVSSYAVDRLPSSEEDDSSDFESFVKSMKGKGKAKARHVSKEVEEEQEQEQDKAEGEDKEEREYEQEEQEQDEEEGDNNMTRETRRRR